MTSLTTAPLRRPRMLGLLVAAGIIVAGTYVAAGIRPPADASSATPAAAGPVTTSSPAALDVGGAPIVSVAQIDHSIEAWSTNLETNPRDFLAATNLAALYQGRGRITYDLTDYERALTAAKTALEIEPKHAPARAVEAAVLFSLHEFPDAFATADALVREDPTQLGALATRFDAALELGRIDDARADLERLATIGGPGVLIREARLASLTGDHATALARAVEAQNAALADEAEDPGFYAYAVGEYARLAGDPVAARAGFTAALRVREGDLAALVGLARIEAFEGHTNEAIAGLRRATEIAPQPDALALLGDLVEEQGAGSGAASFETVRFIERLGDIQAATFDRQLLRFELDHDGATEDLLDRARASAADRPDWTGHDTVAWALYRLGRFDEAAASIDAAHALGADDARLRFHAGAIAVARGATAEGVRLLQAALDLGPALDPIERIEAEHLLGR
jgi:tetratricopeptide (TPR) repeat protein